MSPIKTLSQCWTVLLSQTTKLLLTPSRGVGTRHSLYCVLAPNQFWCLTRVFLCVCKYYSLLCTHFNPTMSVPHLWFSKKMCLLLERTLWKDYNQPSEICEAWNILLQFEYYTVYLYMQYFEIASCPSFKRQQLGCYTPHSINSPLIITTYYAWE